MTDSGTLTPLRTLARFLVDEQPIAQPDWEVLLPVARHHGLAPLLSFQLRRSRELVDTPQDVLQALRADYYIALARYLRVEAQLAQILESLAAVAVPAMVVKGPAIALAYPHPALRTFYDLDIWVLPQQLDRAEKALQDLGYRCAMARPDVLLHHHLPPMLHRGGGIPLEVHWRLDDGQRVGRLPEADLWARAQGWSVDGRLSLRLDAIDTVLHLCRHAVVQNLLHGGVPALFDLAHLTRGWAQAEWETLIERATSYDLARTVYLMLALQEQVLGLAVPPQPLEALRPGGGTPLPSGLEDRLLSLGDEPPPHIAFAATRAWGLGSFRARIAYLLQRLFLSPDAMAAQYNLPAGSPRVWLAYLWRPVALLRQYGPVAWQAFRRDSTARAEWQRDVWLQQWLQEGGAGEQRQVKDWPAP